MAERDTDDEHFCELEQNSYPAKHFGIGPDGKIIHIKVRPNWNNPGQGHTLTGWDVWFEGKEVDFQPEWDLSRVWPRP